MAWIEKRKRYRLRDVIDGKRVVVVKDLGIWKEAAEEAKVDYIKAKTAGFIVAPGSPTLIADVRAFLSAKRSGEEATGSYQRITIEEMCELLIKHHGPSLKGAVSEHFESAFYIWRSKVNIIKRIWKGKFSDEPNLHDVRDLINQYDTVGSRMKYLRTISHMFSAFEEWNEDGTILPFKVRLPDKNPAKQWRKKMKSSDKRELPDTRVLSPEEWEQFIPHLRPRTLAICEMALRRFMRKSDIKAIDAFKVGGGNVFGLQQKTGDRYSVPALENQPTHYDFTNFQKEFIQAQVDADMYYPVGHPLHFSLRSLRRTGATWAYRKTKDLVGISEMLGHRDIATTIRYLNISHADKVAIARAVDEMARRKSGDAGGAAYGK